MKKNYVTLEDVCIKGSSNIAQKDLENNEGKYPIYGASGFIKNVDFYVQEKPYIAVVKDGAGIGRTMMLPAYSSVIGTMQYLLPKDNIDISYLYYAVTAMNLAKYYTGATIPHIYFKDYRKEKLPLVDKLEQKKIVEVLSKIDALRSCHERQLYDFEVLVKSRFIEMFGDPVTNPLHWPICLLGEQIKFITSGSRGWAKYFTNDGAYFITIKNVKNSNVKIDDMQYIIPPNNAEAIRTKVQEGDLLISITADLGRTGVVSKEIAEHGGYINQHLTCVRLNQENVNPLYVSYYMESEAGKRQFNLKNQSAVKAGLNFESIRSLNLMLPPIELQHDYISFVKQVNKSKFTNYKSLLLLIIKKIWYNNYM